MRIDMDLNSIRATIHKLTFVTQTDIASSIKFVSKSELQLFFLQPLMALR